MRRSGGETIEEGKRGLSRYGFRRFNGWRLNPRNTVDGKVDETARDRCIETGASKFWIRAGRKNIGVDRPAATDHKSDHC